MQNVLRVICFVMSCHGSSDDKGLKPLFVIPHEKHREDVEEIVGDDTNIMFITTPGQVGSCMLPLPSVVVGLCTVLHSIAAFRID
jgi:hypothetical protein